MDRGTKIVAIATAGISGAGVAAIFWMAAVGRAAALSNAVRGGVEGVWEVGMSLIAASWLVWGWKRAPAERKPAAWGERGPVPMARRTRWALAATGGLVAATIGLLCVYGSGAEVGPEEMRSFTNLVLDGTVGAVALAWGIWWWVGRRG